MTLRARVDAALERWVAPLLAADAGGIEVVSVDEARAEIVLRLAGALRGCPGTPRVKADVIERVLAREAPGARVVYVV